MIQDLTRRAFLRLTARGSLALAAGDLGRQFPANWLSEPLPAEQNIKAVNLLRYATTCRECPAGCGLHVRHLNGRALKAEGNPGHPVNRGGLCARGQSALQGLYDPDRLTGPRQRRRPGATFAEPGLAAASWQQALLAIGKWLRRPTGRAYVISGLETGVLVEIMRQFAGNFGGELLLFEPFAYQGIREVNAMVTGRPVIPWHALDQCEMILSFGADFLETWLSNVQLTWMFSHMHRYQNRGRMGRFAYVGPRLSMTAANADDFLLVPPGVEYEVAMNILKIMAERGWTRAGGPDYLGLTRAFQPEHLPLSAARPRLEKLAGQFARAEGGVALAGAAAEGGDSSRRLAEAVFLLNQASGNIGKTIDFSRVHALSTTHDRQDLWRLAAGLTADDLLIVHEANPAYVLPGIGAMLKEAGLLVTLGQLPDETSLLADWLLPVDNPLEAWGEYSPWTGIHGFMQPTMNRLYNSRAAGDIFLSLADLGGRPLAGKGGAGAAANYLGWLRAAWQAGAANGPAGQRRLLQTGFSQRAVAPVQPGVLGSAPLAAAAPPARPAKAIERAALRLWPSIFLFDGRTANRSWLQENPHPVSYIAWGSWVDIHPRKAAALGVREGDGLRLSAGEHEVRAPARLTEEIEENTVGLALGQGHWALGAVAGGLGANGFALLDRTGTGELATSVTLAKVNGVAKAICLTASRDQHDREILCWEQLSRLRSGTAARAEIDLPLPAGFNKEADLYQGHRHAGHRWAMAIDLHRCIGCGACAVACYAENNIPVLGPDPVRQGREQAWLKVVPYRHPERREQLGFLPLACQHCDQAPCEPVCPVFAAVHTEDGLNAQVYNRCIGTRYCSQNCPYKVRRFNWLNIAWRPPLEWQLNPQVTVRARGVMEKCTFCVQRIRAAEYRAKLEERPLADGEIQPACVQSCPAGVFTFGDLHDPASKVLGLFENDARGYQLLHELNTKPAVLYLKRIEQQ